jgi:serine/threonine-protein kinase
MATVYRARDLRLGRDVAVKLLDARYSADAEIVRQFQREAQMAADLTAHPNIVSVYSLGRDGDLHFMVMELVEGVSLKSAIEAEGPLSVDRACHIAAEVASALEFAYRHGYVHRDVKPQNILISNEGTVKVADFGMAFSAGSIRLTQTGARLGKAAQYVAPEQARGKPATSVSDVYSLGVVLFEMLTAKLPFEPDSTTPSGGKRRRKKNPRSPSSYRADIPPEVDAIVLRALSNNPRKRYVSVAALREALQGRAGHLVARERRVETRPPTGRHPVLTSLGIIVLLGLCGAGAFATYSRLSAHGGALAVPTPTPVQKTPAPVHRNKHHTTAPAVTPRPKPTAQPAIPHGMGLTYIFVSPALIQPGSMTSLTYTVVNSSGQPVPVDLGATIIRRKARVAFSDRTHAVTVTTSRGTHKYTRQFEVPATAPAGPYQLLVSINTPNMGHNYAQLLIPHLVTVAGSSTG